MNKHTPGPWIAVGQIVLAGSSMRAPMVARCPKDPEWNRHGLPRSECEANAKLIAAAPALLAALEPFAALFLYPDDIDGHEDDDAGGKEELMISRADIRAARKAIKAATT